jgi:hypothetical protein
MPDAHPDTDQPVGFRIDPQPAALPQAVTLRGMPSPATATSGPI